MVLWEFRGVIPDVGAGLVPAPCGATTRVARTPRNPKEPRRFTKGCVSFRLRRRGGTTGGNVGRSPQLILPVVSPTGSSNAWSATRVRQVGDAARVKG